MAGKLAAGHTGNMNSNEKLQAEMTYGTDL